MFSRLGPATLAACAIMLVPVAVRAQVVADPADEDAKESAARAETAGTSGEGGVAPNPLVTQRPPPETGRAPKTTHSTGPVIGVDLGVGIPAGGTSAFRPGLGRAFLFGWRWDAWSVEWRVSERYDMDISVDSDAVIDGQLSIGSFFIRRTLDVKLPYLIPTFAVGGVSLSSPVLVTGSDGYLTASDRHGVGLALAGGVLVPLASGVFLSADVRAYVVRFENALVQDIDDTGALMNNVEPETGIPLSVNVGLQIPL